MVNVWGKVEKYDRLSSTSVMEWEECSRKCLEQPDCMLVKNRHSECRVFLFGAAATVQRTNSIDGGIVGFKRVLSTCPANGSLAPLFVEDELLETYKSGPLAYEIKITGNNPVNGIPSSWTFSENYFIQCQSDSFVSFRGPNKVCISIRTFVEPPYQNWTFGVGLCAENRGMGLTGPNSGEERNVIETLYRSEYAEELKDLFPYANFLWIDGTRTTAENFRLTDNTLDVDKYNAVLASGLNFKKNSSLCCMTLFLNKIRPDAIHCSNTGNGNIRPRGAICKTEPLKQL